MRVQFQEEKMHTKDAIKFALTVSNGAVMSVINEMSGAATTFPTLNGGGHPIWGLGHPTLGVGMIPAIRFRNTNPATVAPQILGPAPQPVAQTTQNPPLAPLRNQ